MLVLSSRIAVVVGVYVGNELVLSLWEVGEGGADAADTCCGGAHIGTGEGSGVFCLIGPGRPRTGVGPVVEVVGNGWYALDGDVESFTGDALLGNALNLFGGEGVVVDAHIAHHALEGGVGIELRTAQVAHGRSYVGGAQGDVGGGGFKLSVNVDAYLLGADGYGYVFPQCETQARGGIEALDDAVFLDLESHVATVGRGKEEVFALTVSEVEDALPSGRTAALDPCGEGHLLHVAHVVGELHVVVGTVEREDRTILVGGERCTVQYGMQLVDVGVAV